MSNPNGRIAGGLLAMPEPVQVAGVPVAPFHSYDQALACIQETIESRRKAFWVAINPQKVFRAWHEPDLLDILNRADVGICDGVGVTVAAKVLLGRRIHRVTGCDLFFKLLPLTAQKGWRVFLLGASEESNSRACENLQQQYPGLQIVGSQSGYFKNSGAVIEHINSTKADMLFVAMGSPAQEYWISQHRDRINAAFCMGVGGSFDIAAGISRRAPAFFRRTGTEWLYQLVTQPTRRLKRQMVYVPFMLRVLGKRLSGSNGSTVWAVKPSRQPTKVPDMATSVQKSAGG
jgi:N-acetylglucosaminyldiphosphoundecaprenol N-acetyl-beta-D-mannosaminyltransferase